MSKLAEVKATEMSSLERARPTLIRGNISPWWIVFGGVIVNAMSAGLFIIYAFNIFAPAMAADYGWSRSIPSMFVALFFISSGIGTIWLGHIISLYGIRRPALLFGALYGATIVAIAILPPSKPLFLANFFLMGVVGAAACAMPFSIAISGFIERSRGLAFGVCAAGAGLGSTIAPQLAEYLLRTVGWRSGILIMSGASTAAILFALAFLLRTPDGVVVRRSARKTTPDVNDRRYLRDPVFWIIIVVLLANSIASIGVLGSLIPILADRGTAATAGAAILSAAGLSSWGGRIVVGWLLDRVFAPYVASTIFALGAVGALLMVYSGAGPFALLGALMIGISLGAEGDVVMYFVSRYFPLSLYSRVVGGAWVAWAWGGGIGTSIGALSYRLTGRYDVSLWFFVGVFASASLIVLRLPAYRVSLQSTHVQGTGDPGGADDYEAPKISVDECCSGSRPRT